MRWWFAIAFALLATAASAQDGDQAKQLAGSVHSFLECASCHDNLENACASCHGEAVSAHAAGVHAKAFAAGNKNAATCFSCHGSPHEIRPSSDPQSRTYRTNVPKTCGSCHSQKFVMEGSGLSAQPIFSYRASVHGQAVAQGSMKAAICTDCHGHHEILSPRDQRSSINKFSIPATCGKCHSAVQAEFMTSIHGKAVAHGNTQAPVCTDCHGIHTIKKHVDPSSSVAAQQIARTTCGQCHGGVRLTQELGLPGGRLTTYQDSYHGLARRLGSNVAANCASCHGVHDILPSSDPHSTINKANLPRTCGKCHPGAGAKFVVGKVHLDGGASAGGGDGSSTAETLITWIRRIYLTAIALTIGFMLLHNALVWWRKAMARRRNREGLPERMNLNQRIQHLLLLTSFLVLVVSGFALAYPESPFAWILGSDEFVRRIIHRVAAVVMLGLGVYHVVYMVGTREGRQGLRDFWWRMRDARDLADVLRGRHTHRARFDYGEKAEYWAVIWGTVVMGATGLMLWAKITVSHFLPRWWVDVALAIHFYEAVLATLAIVVWHFYHVMFDPDVYPMKWTWIDGKSEEESADGG